MSALLSTQTKPTDQRKGKTMELKLQNKLPASRIFNYVPTYFDNGVKYGVWHGGRAPLNGGGGKYIGQVARLDYDAFFGPYREEWHAASANGSQDADKLNWHGPFKTRMEASIFLTGLTDGYSGAITEIAEG
jgi:hypothetical protein